MLAIDTNVVVRYLANDDTEQAAGAQRLLARHDVVVPLTVLLESEWVLRTVFGFPASDVVRALRGFAGLPRVTIESADTAAQALNWAERGWILPTLCIWRPHVRRTGSSHLTKRLPGLHAGSERQPCGNRRTGDPGVITRAMLVSVKAAALTQAPGRIFGRRAKRLPNQMRSDQ